MERQEEQVIGAAGLRGIAVALGLLLLASSCGGAGPVSSPTPDPLAGRYKAFGGGGALPQIDALTKRFAELHPGVIWEISDVGSDSSIQLTSHADVDMGFISRDLKTAEKGLVETLSIGATGTAVILNTKNPVSALTKDQVRMIFAGELTDWSQIGGTAGKIRVILREKDSATRSNFESYFFDGKPVYSKDAIEIFEIEETLKAVASVETAIGMATLAPRTITTPGLKLPAIDGLAATKENLDNGSWKIRRSLYIVYNPDPAKVKPAIKAFLDFVKGPEGQRILANV